ncbi:MAG: choice-of-anchor D domain-containing protein, partial [Burkholderiales bacterium]
NRNLTPAQIKAILQSTARRPLVPTDLGLDCSIDTNRHCYNYLVDAAAAVAAAQDPMLNTVDGNGNNLSLLNFGSVSLGSNSQREQIVVRNPFGTPIRIYDVKLAGKDNGDFNAATTCGNALPAAAYPFDLQAGASCSIDVTFKPTIEGVRAAEVVIASNVNIPVSVTGSGVAGSSGGGSSGGGCTLSAVNSLDPTLLLLAGLSLIYFATRRLPRR